MHVVCESVCVCVVLGQYGGGGGRGGNGIAYHASCETPPYRYDYRGFDLGNLACEFTFSYAVSERPGYTFDASKYPTEAQMGAFFDEYAAYLGETSRSSPGALATEMQSGVLASHLYWALWSILMGAGQLGYDWAAENSDHAAGVGVSLSHDCSVSDSPVVAGHSVFDYVHYGTTRAREYLRLKQLQGGTAPAADIASASP
jgi:hypothetical protein